MDENQGNPEKPIVKGTELTMTIPIGNNGIVLQTMEDMYRFSNYVVKSGLAPKSFQTPEQIMIAIQSGAELRMPPMRSLQSFCVVNGAARLWGDAPLALVRQSGLLEWIKESVTGEGDQMVATCETKRKGEPNLVKTTFSVGDAKKAHLWGKTGTWTTHPNRMLKYKARAFNLRDNFPDCFGGTTIAEEFYGIEDKPKQNENGTAAGNEGLRKILTGRKQVESEVTDTPVTTNQEQPTPSQTPPPAKKKAARKKADKPKPTDEKDEKTQAEFEKQTKALAESEAELDMATDKYTCLSCNRGFGMLTPTNLCPHCFSKKVKATTEPPETQPEIAHKYTCMLCSREFGKPTEDGGCPHCPSKDISETAKLPENWSK